MRRRDYEQLVLTKTLVASTSSNGAWTVRLEAGSRKLEASPMHCEPERAVFDLLAGGGIEREQVLARGESLER